MFLSKRFYIIASVIVILLIAGYVFPAVFVVGKVAVAVFAVFFTADSYLLYNKKNPLAAERYCASRFSNGDENEVRIEIENYYNFTVKIEIIDEIPAVFQRRDVLFHINLKAHSSEVIKYVLRPAERGVYGFGNILLYISSPVALINRRIKSGTPADIAVYPSYVMLAKYEFMAIHHNLTETGIKKIRRRGHNTEFESIKEYIKGDDFRTVNWKASARRSRPMVNVYQDERSQQIYSIIDKGRVMQSAFGGMTLLDYAINASLVLSYVAVHKDDKAGLATFSADFETFVQAGKQNGQMQRILESLYHQQTDFGESDYSSLYVNLNKHINKRSLMIIYTNFDTLTGIGRQIEYLRKLSQRHVVLVVFFEDREIKNFSVQKAENIEQYYQQVIACKFIADKRHVALKLRQYGIHTLLTDPENLSVNVINKYLEMKQRGTI